MCRELNINFDCYSIFDDGTIFSNWFKGKQVSGCPDKDGYTLVKLKLKDGSYDQFRLHRVIWVYFNGEIPEGKVLDHIVPISNGGGNELSNLRCVTPKENSNNHSTKLNISSSLTGKPHPSMFNNSSSRPVIRITQEGGIIEYPSASECGRQGINQSEVCKCCNGGYYLRNKWYNRSHYYKGDRYYWKKDYSCIK